MISYKITGRVLGNNKFGAELLANDDDEAIAQVKYQFPGAVIDTIEKTISIFEDDPSLKEKIEEYTKKGFKVDIMKKLKRPKKIIEIEL